jgi:hypothetical protein
MKIEKTNRGFEIINFTDHYKVPCSLQQSSLAEYEPPGTSAIWFGVDERRMHLSLKQVKELIPILTNWVNSGSFKKEGT